MPSRPTTIAAMATMPTASMRTTRARPRRRRRRAPRRRSRLQRARLRAITIAGMATTRTASTRTTRASPSRTAEPSRGLFERHRAEVVLLAELDAVGAHDRVRGGHVKEEVRDHVLQRELLTGQVLARPARLRDLARLGACEVVRRHRLEVRDHLADPRLGVGHRLLAVLMSGR